jgi:YesN/AraC family two-component response regulator
LLDEARKRDAIKLLQNTSLTIEQIASRLGYTDPANFSRAFKKWTGERVNIRLIPHSSSPAERTPSPFGRG